MLAVGLLTVELHISGARSLKDKRRVIASVKDRLRKLNVSIAELDHHDLRQRAKLGVVAIATHRDVVDRSLNAVLTEVERNDPRLIIATDIEWLS